jgi:hypothetical protein
MVARREQSAKPIHIASGLLLRPTALTQITTNMSGISRAKKSSHEYGANGSDFHHRRRARCQGGAAGLEF